MISGVSEKTCNALDKWLWFTYDVGISLPWSCCCSTDGMWGMRVCEWTRRELTLNIRFTGGDYGALAETGEKDKQSQGQWERQEEGDAGKRQGEWRKGHEMKWGVWSPWDRSCLTGGVSDVMQSPWKNGHHRLHRPFIMATHNGKGDGGSLRSMYLFVTPPSFLCPSHKRMNISHFPLQILGAAHLKISPESTLFVRKFSLRGTWFYSGPLLYLQMAVSLFSFILIDAVATVETFPARRRQIRASEMKTLPPLLDDNCMWLCLHLVYLWVFDHDSMRRCLIPGVLWQFCRLAKGPPVSEVRSEETGAWKAGVQLGEDQKRRKL